MVKTGDRFQAENLGEFLAVLKMKDGSEFHIGTDTLEEAEQTCKAAIEHMEVRKAFSATRNGGGS